MTDQPKRKQGWPEGRRQTKEHSERIGRSLKASGKSGLHNPENKAKGRKAQHSARDEEGKSLCAKKAGAATAGLLGFTSSGKSVMGAYRIHLRWQSPVKDPEARIILDEMGYLGSDGVPLSKEEREAK